MYLKGARFNVIDRVYDFSITKLFLKGWVAEIVAVCIDFDTTYVTGQHIVEALWRTLICDCAAGKCPAPSSVGVSFRVWLVDQLATAARIHCEDKDSAQLALGMTNAILASLNVDGSHPHLATPADVLEEYEELGRRRETTGGARSPRTVTEFTGPLQHAVSGSRKLFKTRMGLLGLGPRSVEEGDEVWMLEVATTPYIMEKVSEERDYRIVGEAYLHGFMHGEILDPDWKLNVEPLRIL